MLKFLNRTKHRFAGHIRAGFWLSAGDPDILPALKGEAFRRVISIEVTSDGVEKVELEICFKKKENV